jgi:tRNA-dihydrouridine synthase
MSKVPAHWEIANDAVTLRDKLDPKKQTLILGNGDVENVEGAKEKVKNHGVDGVMIGRGIFGNPWCFNKEKSLATIPLKERLEVMLAHTLLFEKTFTDKKTGKLFKNFDVMKKHYKTYASGFDGAKELRVNLMATKNGEEVREIVEAYCATLES